MILKFLNIFLQDQMISQTFVIKLTIAQLDLIMIVVHIDSTNMEMFNSSLPIGNRTFIILDTARK